jgi:dTDP-4-amino-4,6-dideoxygalactose transaminase
MSANVPALEGGTPVRSGTPVPFFRAALSDADIQAVTETLRSGWLTLGPRTAEFESACAAYLQAPHALATSSCTAALFLALRALEIGADDEVIVPSLTFPSTVNTIHHVGAVPVLADIELVGFGLDAAEVAAAITPRTRAVIGVDYGGQPCDLGSLGDLARERGLALVEDAAHSFGAAFRGRPVGAWADATAFSFYATKCITTGEGGLLTCLDNDVAERARLLGFHGMQRHAWKRYSDRGSWFYEIECAGYKFNMSDVQASLGMSQLKRADDLREARAQVAAEYRSAFGDAEALVLPGVRPQARHAWHLYAVQLELEALRVDRDHFARALREEGIVPSVHFIPYHRHPVARADTPRRSLARTEHFAERCLSLPLFPHMPQADVEDVVQAVRKLVRYYAR